MTNDQIEAPAAVEQNETRESVRLSVPLVVGVGASAGGVEAFQELLHELGDSREFAIVYVQHLEKDSFGLLIELLRKWTSLPIVEITGRKKLKAGTVYICPPSQLLELKSGMAKIVPPEDDNRPTTPIDYFLHSLAEDQGERSLGVILSGAGSDGTLGLKAISDAGGLTFAQSTASSKFESMPRSAATTGVADHVLAPREIAAELKKYVRYLGNSSEGNLQTTEIHGIHEALPEISKLLIEATNHNFQHYKPNTLVRRIRRRMHILKQNSVETYVSTLKDDPDEPQALFRELLISVTAFFRDPEAFEVIEKTVIPRLFADRKPHKAVRIWVPGCASGEEAFTLAILCREYMEKLQTPPEVQIFATDIDERALRIGRHGIYPLGIEEDVSQGRLARFFTKRGKKFQITKEVRELVLFSSHNLISDPPFSRLDMISCRNLLIYLGSHLQKKLIPVFHYSLRRSGYLMLGPSENISTHGDLFNMIDVKNRIAQRQSTGVDTSAAVTLETSGTNVESTPRIESSRDSAEDLMQVMQRIVLDEFAPKSVIVEENGRILCASADMHKYLTVGMGSFQNNIIKMARSGLRVGLRATLQEAKEKRRRVVHDDLSVRVDGKLQRVMLTVQPMPRIGEKSEIFMVVFHDAGLPLLRGEALESETAAAETSEATSKATSIIAHLERELSSTRDDLERSIQQLETANEELKASNEELLSLNEEMQSANEELETSKEEIEAAVNAIGQSNSDLENLLRSTRIATIFLDDQLHIRSFTPAATSIYGLIATDIGRPLAHLMPLSNVIPPLPDPQTVTGNEPVECNIQTRDGRWFVRRVLPYHSQSGERDGIVVTFVDITDQKAIELVLQERAKLAALHSKLALNLGSEAPLGKILQACCQELAVSLDAAFARIWLLDDEQTLQLEASAGMLTIADNEHNHSALGESEIRRIALNKQPFRTNDIVNDRTFGELEWARREGMIAFAGYPLVVENRLVGVVALFAQRALSEETFEQLLPMADAIAQCIARKRSEQELQDREARLRRVIDNAVCFIGILDNRGILQEANEAALLAGGLDREDVFGKPFWECYWWSHDEQAVHDLKAAIATALQGEVVRYDVEVRMAGDSRLMIDFMLAPVKDADGKIAYLIPSGVDISERKYAERQLQQRVHQLDLALDTGRMGIWEWDIPGDLVKWSPQLYDMYGYTEANFVPSKAGFLNAVHPDDRKKLESLIKSTYIGDCVDHDVEFRVIRGDTGEAVWTHCRGTTVRDSNGQPLSIQSVSIDVTARKRRELSLAFLAGLQNKLAALTSADDIMRVASTNVVNFLQLSRLLVVEIDETAELAKVIFDQRDEDLEGLSGSYQMAEFASEEERRLLALGQPMIVNDTTDPSRGQKSIQNFAKLKVASIINSPGTRNQRLEFMLSAVKPTAHMWQDDEVQMLRELSTILRLKLERVRAEEALRASEARFRDLADNMSQFAWVTDPFGSIAWYNKRWFDYTGTTFEDMQGWGWRAVHHPDHIERVVKRWESCLSAGEVWEDTFPLRSKTGEYRWFLSLARPIRDEDGNIVRWFGTNTDITDAKEQEQRIRESEERLRSAAQAAGFGTVHIDLETRSANVSDELRRIIGLPGNEADKVSANSMPSFIHADDHETFAAFVRDLTRLQEGSASSIDLRILRPDGEIRWVRLQAKPVYSGLGASRRPTQVIGTVLDITKQREFEHSLNEARALAEAANESKSAFLANMSHEIRTPMTAILGYTDLVADRVQDDEAASHLRTIRRNGYFLLDIINDILDLSKIEAGMLDVSRECFAPDQLVEDVRSIMEVRAAERHLTLDVEYRGLIPAQIESDAKRLKQILINLVGNAIKFTKQGSVQVVVSYRDQSLQFDIIDTGIGMTKHQQKRLFQPFSQGDHTVNREFGGTGLGLAISQRIATLLGGNISAKSEPNKGSTFTVTIATGDISDLKLIQPVHFSDPKPDEMPTITVELACRILVVDDRRDIRFLSRRFLAEAGATVVEAEDGEVAISIVSPTITSSSSFDLIILDMQMPKLDGYETAKQLRQLGFSGPIIALTADAMHGDMSRCLASGCNDYLSKPIDKAALLKMVSDYVGRNR